MNATQRTRMLLAAGALAGVALAARGVWIPAHRDASLPNGAIASVGGVTIPRADFDREMAGIAAERRDRATDPSLRRHVLDRLIDEAVIVERGLSLGLARTEPRVRAELTTAVIEMVLAGDDPPRTVFDEASLRAFYGTHASEFSSGGRVHAARLIFTGEGAEARARDAIRRWNAGDPLDTLGVGSAPDVTPPPEGPVPASVLARYVGPALATALDTTPVRGTVGPLPADPGGFVVGFVLSRVEATPPPFEEVRDLIAQTLRRRDDDRRLRAWLDARRSELAVVRSRDVP